MVFYNIVHIVQSLYNIVHIVQSFEKVLINWLKPFKTYKKYCKIIELIFIKDCTIAAAGPPISYLDPAVLQHLPFATDKPVVGVPISREFIQKYILGVNSACHGAAAGVPLQVQVRHCIPALRQRPQTPAFSNRNARRCTSTVWAIIMLSDILFLMDIIQHSTTTWSKSKSRKFTLKSQ